VRKSEGIFAQARLAFAVCLLVAPAAAQTALSDSFFVEQLYPVLVKAECRLCHNDSGVASATRLQFPPADAGPGAVRAFGLRLENLVNRADPSQSLLWQKPTLRMQHAGGERIPKGSSQEKLLRAWVDHLARTPESELRSAIGPPPELKRQTSAVRRLTHSQYNNTVRDLLGDFTRPADQFPQDDFLHGFTNQAEGQSVPPILAEAYTVAAEKLAANAIRFGETQRLIPCRPASALDPSCRDRFVREFGLRTFRRPLSDAETADYASLFHRAAAKRNDFQEGVKMVIEAMLQSPNFLFHLEEGPDGRLRGYAAASRLSYFLWDTMPDGTLLDAAAKGELDSLDGIRRAARRMMDNPQARRALDGFLAQWMRFDRVLASARNVRRVPDFSASLLASMVSETSHLFQHLVWNDGNFMEFFNAPYTFVSARLAQHYGFEAPAVDFALTKYPQGSKRAGVLGHAGFLTMTATAMDTSPTARGLFVREQFLCQLVPPPPPGVDTNLPVVTVEKPMTSRERLAVHLNNASCAGCHNLIDPIGLGLEGFDDLGRARDKITLQIQQERDAVTNERGEPKVFELPLDTSGTIHGIPNSSFSSAAELGNILANDPTCQRCMVKQLFRYALGRHETDADRPYLEALYEGFRKSGFRYRELMLALVSSPPFLGEPAAVRAAR
jgi:hypothetical protein